jgi:hypothetical protein
MRTLTIAMSDSEYAKFGLTSDRLTLLDFMNIVSRETMRQRLDESVAFAKKYGLSDLTMDEITAEVSAARKDAKSCN